MFIFGLLLIFLAAPLLITYSIQPPEKKNKTWLRLGSVLAGVGVLLLFIPG